MSEFYVAITPRETLIGTLNLGVEYFKGDSGVYLGDSQPTDDQTNVWIEPDAEASGTIVTQEELDSKGYMTEAEVRALIAELMKGEA